MKQVDPAGAPWARGHQLVLVLWLAVLILNLIILGERLASLSGSYRLFITEGGEGPHIYAIWRLLHGFPLYQWPNRYPFSLTFYNFAFYWVYSWILGAAGIDGEALLWAGRALTLAIALAGCVAYARFAYDLVPEQARARRAALFLTLYAPVLWLGTNFTSWWALSIRPDIGAAFCTLLGLWMTSRHLRTDPSRLAGASVLFWLAWAFKQSFVLTFVAVLLFTVVAQRRFRAALWLAAPFACLAATTLILGGAALRYNLLAAPAAVGFSWTQAASIAGRVAGQNLFVWFPALVLASAFLYRWLSSRPGGGANDELDGLLATVVLLTLAGGLVLVGREGSNKNQFMESYLACGLLSARWFLVSSVQPGAVGRRAILATLGLSLPVAAFPAGQMAWPNRFGVTRLADGGQYAAKEDLSLHLRALPKPVLVLDDVLSQPWHATDDHYPALVLDPVWVDVATRHGSLPQSWMDSLMRGGGFASAILQRGSAYQHAAMANGFRCAALEHCPLCDAALVECRREASGVQH